MYVWSPVRATVTARCRVKTAFYDADTDTDILVSFSLLQEIARVGRQDVGMSVESESVSAS